jgi:hypothetical protein
MARTFPRKLASVIDVGDIADDNFAASKAASL